MQRRGREIVRRRKAHEIPSVRQLSEITGIARGTLTRVEAGIGTEESTRRVEGFLDRLDRERGMDTARPDSALPVPDTEGQDMIEFDITGPRTEWHAVVRGPAEIADELRRQAVELLREIDPRD